MNQELTSRATRRQWYERNREKARAAAKAWYQSNKGRHRELKRAWELRNPEKVAAKNAEARWRRVGMKEARYEQYEELNTQQNGLCAICGKPNKNGRKLAWDHSHFSRQPRGLLCGSCNIRLGWLENLLGDPEWFTKSEEYLSKYDETPQSVVAT